MTRSRPLCGSVGAHHCIETSPALALMGRLFGGVLLTLSVILWLAKDFRDEAAVRAVLLGALLGDVVNLVVATMGKRRREQLEASRPSNGSKAFPSESTRPTFLDRLASKEVSRTAAERRWTSNSVHLSWAIIICAVLFGRWQKSTRRSGRLVRIAHFQTRPDRFKLGHWPRKQAST
jgi:hypothetical protein